MTYAYEITTGPHHNVSGYTIGFDCDHAALVWNRDHPTMPATGSRLVDLEGARFASDRYDNMRAFLACLGFHFLRDLPDNYSCMFADCAGNQVYAYAVEKGEDRRPFTHIDMETLRRAGRLEYRLTAK